MAKNLKVEFFLEIQTSLLAQKSKKKLTQFLPAELVALEYFEKEPTRG